MRRDKQVIFHDKNDGEPVMDSEGNFQRGQGATWKVYAHVSHLGAERQNMEFGDVVESRKVVRILHRPPFTPVKISIDDKPHTVQRRIRVKNKSVYIVSED